MAPAFLPIILKPQTQAVLGACLGVLCGPILYRKEIGSCSSRDHPRSDLVGPGRAKELAGIVWGKLGEDFGEDFLLS